MATHHTRRATDPQIRWQSLHMRRRPNKSARLRRWTLDLQPNQLVKLTEHESVSRETVRLRLAENKLKPWRKKMWCIPQIDAEYIDGVTGRAREQAARFATAVPPENHIRTY